MTTVTIRDKKELLEYKEREKIYTLVYQDSQVLEKGDLPVGGLLKEVKFTSNQLHAIKGDSIPYGVEKLVYSQSMGPMRPTTLLSTLPTSIKTIENVIPHKDGNVIPSNITSISYKFYGDEITNMNIPTTITSLVFGKLCRNNSKILKVGDLHKNLKIFSMVGYDQLLDLNVVPASLTELEIGVPSNGVLNTGLFPHDNIKSLKLYCHPKEPTSKRVDTGDLVIINESISTLTKLETLSIDKSEGVSIKFEVNSIPTNISKLSIHSFDSPINNCTLPIMNCNNLKSVELEYSKFNENDIISSGAWSNSNLEHLKIMGCFNTPLQIGSLPNNIKSLSFFKCTFNQPINQVGILPNSLTSLEFSDISCDNLLVFFSITLPESLDSITLHQNLKDKNINFPSQFKNINYLNYYVDI